jgi:predicted CXXCH cytochrome family protein
MARVLGPIGPDELEGVGAATDAAGWSYRFERTASAPTIVESRRDAPEYRRAVPLDLAIGAGVLDRAYTERPLACESCHDPHFPRTDAGERARVRAACLGCHSSEPSPESRSAVPCAMRHRSDADCASCHMRVTPPFDVAGVEITDHWIARVPGPPSSFDRVRARAATDGKIERFRWPGAPPPENVDDPGLAMMMLSFTGATRETQGDAAGFRADLERSFHARPRTSVARMLAEAWSELDDAAAAERWTREAEHADPTSR